MSLSRFFRRSRWDDERAREIEAHLAIEIDDNVARGMTPDAARLAARRKFGNATRVREDIYQMNTVNIIDSLWRDLRYGARVLLHNKMFAAIAILSLALGIGANTAIFQLIDAVQFRTLPVRAPEELVEIQTTFNTWGHSEGDKPEATYAMWDRLRQDTEPFSAMLAWGTNRFDLSSSGESHFVNGLWVSGDFFNVLGVPPEAGRVFTTRDDTPGCGAAAVVISHAFWQRQYAGAGSAIGQTLHLDGHPFEIVGVTPASFTGVQVGKSFDVAVPICAQPFVVQSRSAIEERHFWWLDVFARLRPGWTIERTNAHLAAISPAFNQATTAPAFPSEVAKAYLNSKLEALPALTGVGYLRGRYRQPLWVLFAVAGLVLLIACANLANLMLARATAREREIAVRLAIGASRGRIVRQLLAESVLVAAVGAALGIVLAQSFSRFLVSLISTDTSQLFFNLQSNWRVLGFTTALAAATCLLFGLTPALRATRQDAAAAMKAGARGSTDSHERFGLRRTLVVVQVGLSFVLIVGALLFVRTVRNLGSAPTGFDTANVLVADFDVRSARVPRERQIAFKRALRERIVAVPGVVSAVEAFVEPFGGSGWNDRILVDGHVRGVADENRVSPGFFRTLGTRIVAGRDFDDHDSVGAPTVAIVNEVFVKKFLDGRNGIGRTFHVQVAPGEADPIFEVVGIAADTKYDDVRKEPRPMAYYPETQDAIAIVEPILSQEQVIVRAGVPLAQLTPAITAAVRDVSPGIIVDYTTIDGDIRKSFVRERMMAIISGFFGALAALIAMIGLYGVMSYMVARRKNEIGIRMALGADRRDVLGLILRDAAKLLIIGLVVGAAASLAAAQAAKALLFGLSPNDPGTLVMAAAGLGAVALLASYLPARRASRLEPTIALREE